MIITMLMRVPVRYDASKIIRGKIRGGVSVLSDGI
jgi:hypothetical protein